MSLQDAKMPSLLDKHEAQAKAVEEVEKVLEPKKVSKKKK